MRVFHPDFVAIVSGPIETLSMEVGYDFDDGTGFWVSMLADGQIVLQSGPFEDETAATAEVKDLQASLGGQETWTFNPDNSIPTEDPR